MKKLIFFTVLAVFLLSCDDGKKNEEEINDRECFSNADCPDGAVCSDDGICVLAGNDEDGFLPEGDADIYDPENDVLTDNDSDTELSDGSDDSDVDTIDMDSDGDGILDSVEKPNGIAVDTDEDGIPDYLDEDSDGDGIPDSVELTGDVDNDKVPNYRDTDSDDDGIPDSVEAGENPEVPVDSDLDSTPDCYDIDSDNDGIKDVYEGSVDSDSDLIPNYLDADSDGDGIPDCIEKNGVEFMDTDLDGFPDCYAAPDYSSPPADTDGDKDYDFIDLDSDGDGLGDIEEVVCPDLMKDGRVWSDVDGDGFSDLAEKAVGSSICDKEEGVTDVEGVDFYFELPYGEPEKTDVLVFMPTVKKADVFFNIDTTGSMDGELYNLKHSLSSTIIPETRAKISNSAFGISQFRDEDETSMIQINPSSDLLTVQQAVNTLVAEFGGDGPEAGYFSLDNLVSNGIWRTDTIPIAVHITDAVSHERGVADKAAVISALKAKGVKVLTVLSDGGHETSTARTQLTELSDQTGAVVPDCAGAGRTTLLYEVSADGTGLDDAVVNGIDAMVKYALFDVYTLPADDGDVGTPDTSCFLKKIESLEYVGADECAQVATTSSFNGSAYNNGFENFSTGTSSATVPGSKLKFTVHAQNDTCIEPTDRAQAFTANIHIVDALTGSYLDTQKVTIIVPPEIGGLSDD